MSLRSKRGRGSAPPPRPGPTALRALRLEADHAASAAHHLGELVPRETLTRALDRVFTDESHDQLRCAIAVEPEVDPLDALRDAAELVALLNAWRWQAVQAARRSGGTWDQIAAAKQTTAKAARDDHAAGIARQEQIRRNVTAYREVL